MSAKDRGYETLDAAVIMSALGIIAFISWSLVFRTVPENQLAILASIASAITGGIIGAYCGYRWATSKQASETIANLAGKAPRADSPEAIASPPHETKP